MSGIQIADAKAPWIMFERRAVEDRAATIAEGRYVAKDVDFVLITPHGSKDQIEREATEWLDNMNQQVREQRLDPAWLNSYRNAYENWKGGREIPLEGTPIINWPLLSPAQVRMLQDLRVLTVEVLAEANEEVIRRLGMGGRNLVQKAKDFLSQAAGPGKVAEELTAMRVMIEGQGEQIKALTEANQHLRAQIKDGPSGAAEAPDTGGDAISGAELFDKTPMTKL